MLDDLRIGIRVFWRNPAFAGLAILTLALGIGANTAMFSVVNGVLLRPLPFPDPGRVVVLNTPSADRPDGSHSAADFLDILAEQQSFKALAGFRSDLFAVLAPGGQAQQFQGVHVTAQFFDVFALPAELGRTLTASADADSGGGRAVLSHQAAAALDGDPASLIGRSLKINGQSTLIVGVMPSAFDIPADAGVWLLSAGKVPPSPMGDAVTDRELRYFNAIGRLADKSDAAVQTDLDRMAAMLNAQRRGDAEERRLSVTPLHDEIVGDVRPAIVILQVGVGLVLLIACVNISSLLIAGTAGRGRELAVRSALGAGSGRLVRQLLTESIVLGVTGGALGLLFGYWGLSALVRVLPSNLPRTGEIAIDGSVALVSVLAALVASLLFGSLPALHAARTRASAVLRTSDRRTMSGKSFSRSALVVLEVALTLVLLVSAGLLGGSLTRLQSVDPGFLMEGVTVGSMGIPQTRYPDGDAQTAFYRRLLEALAERGEFESAAIGFPQPLAGKNASGTFSILGRPVAAGAERPFGHLNSVSPAFLKTMGIHILQGRDFTEADMGETPVAIVSAEAARRYWPNGDVLGSRITFDEEGTDPPFTIVGVSSDVRQLGLREAAPVLVYFPYPQFPLPFTTVAVKSRLSETVVASALRETVRSVDAELPTPAISTLSAIVEKSLVADRFRSFVFGVLALVALALATVGVYGIVSYSVAQQTREIGIRVALGASPRQVLARIVAGGATLALTGVVLGLGAAWFATGALSRFLFGVGAADPFVFAGVSLVLLAVSVAASYVPARRALRVDPMIALRAD